MEQYGRQTVAGLMMEINFQQHWEVSRGGIAESGINTEDFVSTAREVSQLKFIAHFICKAQMAGKINHSRKHDFISL